MPWQITSPIGSAWSAPPRDTVPWIQLTSPSHESRLNPVYPLSVNPAGDLDFVWQIKTDGFFVIATGNGVQIKSRITDGP